MAVNMAKLKGLAGKFLQGEKLGLHKEGRSGKSRAGTTGMDVRQSMGTHSDTTYPESSATSSRKRCQPYDLSRRMISAAAIACTLFAPSPSYSVSCLKFDDRAVLELSALGKQGDTIARARRQVLEILQQENACSAWFQDADPDPAEVVRSLHFALERRGPEYIYGIRDSNGGHFFKHPWAARSIENGGRYSTILLNANGPFFNRTSVLMQLDPRGMPARPDGDRLLTVSSYVGNTPEAQITILLHELGHILGRLPEDGDSLDGRSSRNTSEVLRHCRSETHAAAHNPSRGTF